MGDDFGILEGRKPPVPPMRQMTPFPRYSMEALQWHVCPRGSGSTPVHLVMTPRPAAQVLEEGQASPRCSRAGGGEGATATYYQKVENRLNAISSSSKHNGLVWLRYIRPFSTEFLYFPKVVYMEKIIKEGKSLTWKHEACALLSSLPEPQIPRFSP